MDPQLALELLTQPWLAGAALGILILLWWMLRRGRRQTHQAATADSERFAQRRARANEGTTPTSAATAPSAPEVTPSSALQTPTTEPKAEADTVSGSRWMQSGIPTGDASEVSDSELAVWGPTAIMSALDEAAAMPGQTDPKPPTGA